MPFDLLDRGILLPGDDQEKPNELSEPDEIDSLLNDSGDGAGLGTGTLISAINSLPSKSSDNIFDVVMVNVSTLVRNNYTKEKSEKEVMDSTKADIHELITTVANYHEAMGGIIKTPTLIFYLPDYSYLPTFHTRPLKGNRKAILDITAKLVREDNLKQRKRIRDYERQTTVSEVFAGDRQHLPYYSLIEEITDLYKLGRVDPRTAMTNFLLISHNPLDYHFVFRFKRTTILESFTGKFIKPKQLGNKVFVTNFIPFNSVTHLLFGDSILVSPIALRKNRQRLTDMAKSQSWYVRTKEEIAKFVGNSGQVDARILMQLKF